jgi:hypothetical protein
MSARKPTVLDVGNSQLFVYAENNEYLIELYHLTRVLGYLQPRSISKQLDRNWKHKIVENVDYFWTHDPTMIQNYLTSLGQHIPKKSEKTPPHKLCFIRFTGVYKILRFTTREEKHSLVASLGQLDARFQPQQSLPLDVPPQEPQEAPEPAVKKVAVERSPEDYDILRELLSRLMEIEELGLRALAIYTAETGLGRPLPKELRYQLLQRPLQKESPTTLKPLQNEEFSFPREKQYFSLTEIGRVAGGFSARCAGRAANTIAQDYGYTPTQIRNTKLSFNQLETRPDPQTGRQLNLTRYNLKFATLVAQELRSNPEFRPEPTDPHPRPVITGPIVGGFEF